MSQLLNLIEGIFSNSRQIPEMLYPEYFSKIRQKLSSSNIWIAFWNVLSRSVFVRMIFFHSFYYLLPVPILFLAAILIL